jgi:lactoylglutathione lyase
MGCNCEGCNCSKGVSGLSHIGVFVRDTERSLAFYSKLGFECYSRAELPNEGGAVKLAFLRCGTCEIELIEKAVYEERKDGKVDHIALKVENIDVTMRQLIDNGVTFDAKEPVLIPSLFDNGIKNMFFRGPDGESLELVEAL